MPLWLAKGAQQSQRRRFDLINGLGTVHRPVWLVWIVEGKPGIHKLVHGLPPHRFSGVRRIFLFVVLPCPIHAGCDAHERVCSPCPRLAGRQVQQGQQAKG